jgi:hypothetical protein
MQNMSTLQAEHSQLLSMLSKMQADQALLLQQKAPAATVVSPEAAFVNAKPDTYTDAMRLVTRPADLARFRFRSAELSDAPPLRGDSPLDTVGYHRYDECRIKEQDRRELELLLKLKFHPAIGVNLNEERDKVVSFYKYFAVDLPATGYQPRQILYGLLLSAVGSFQNSVHAFLCQPSVFAAAAPVKLIYALKCIADEYLDSTTLTLTRNPWLQISRPNSSTLATLLTHIRTVYTATSLVLPPVAVRFREILLTFDRLILHSATAEEQVILNQITATDRKDFDSLHDKLLQFNLPVYETPSINYMQTKREQDQPAAKRPRSLPQTEQQVRALHATLTCACTKDNPDPLCPALLAQLKSKFDTDRKASHFSCDRCFQSSCRDGPRLCRNDLALAAHRCSTICGQFTCKTVGGPQSCVANHYCRKCWTKGHRTTVCTATQAKDPTPEQKAEQDSINAALNHRDDNRGRRRWGGRGGHGPRDS